jgi:quercetin dioxygenase-like cupin family protein
MTEPRYLPYTIAGRDLVAEISGLRVQVLTLGQGERIPWHYHSTVHDIFVCLEGTTIVETRAPRNRHELKPGEHCMVPPMTAHEVTSKGAGCKFTIVQGVGEHDFNLTGATAAPGGPEGSASTD